MDISRRGHFYSLDHCDIWVIYIILNINPYNSQQKQIITDSLNSFIFVHHIHTNQVQVAFTSWSFLNILGKLFKKEIMKIIICYTSFTRPNWII